MSWFIDPKINDGFPWTDLLPKKFNTTWYADGDIELPYYIWRISAANNRTPSNHFIPPVEMKTGWTSVFGGIQLPHDAWRIESGVNDDFPFKWWWFHKESETDDGTIETDHGAMVIGGGQSNYPPYTPSDRGGVRDSMDDLDMSDIIADNPLVNFISSEIALALNDKIFACSPGNISMAIYNLNNPQIFEQLEKNLIMQVYGANVYDGISLCKVFPMPIHFNSSTIQYATPKVFGVWPLVDDSTVTNPKMAKMDTVHHTYSMGVCAISAKQAWELEQIEWSLYLPFAGTFSIDIRSTEPLKLLLSVDYLTGEGEWILTQGGQIIGIFKCQLGWDFPIITSKGETASNALAFAQYTLGQGLSLVSQAAGPALPPGVSEGIGAAADIAKATTQHYSVNAPSIGGLAGCCCYPRPRLIAKIPKMHLQGMGYAEILGDNRSMAVEMVSQCTGFIKCENYCTDLIVATEEEKKLINDLMNSGVFV